MRGKKFLVALALTIVVGAGATVYAETTNNSKNQCSGVGAMTTMRGHDAVDNVLKNKLGMTDKEINDGLTSGKTMYDLAKEKGMTLDEFKAAVIEERTKAIDEAVSKGSMTKEQGDILKENIKNNMNNCTGDMGQMNGKGMGMGMGMKGQGRMSGNGHHGGGCSGN